MSTWQARRSDAAPSEWLAQHGRLLGQLLWQRGLHDAEEAERFLTPRLDSLQSPFRLHGLEAASERVAHAILQGERIAVYADYDMDGISGLALLFSFLRDCGAAEPLAYQPDRLSEGYGVHPEAISRLADKGAQVVITVDTGITAREAAVEAKARGIELIITDHHQQVGDLPIAHSIVNPNQQIDQSGLTYLSGAGVAFYLALGTRIKLRQLGYFAQRKEPDLREWLDLFALGTIADIVELRGDNRVLLRAGLHYLSKTQRPGLRALLSAVLPEGTERLAVRDVEWSVTPKLNAASRLGQAHLSTELLLSQDPARAAELVTKILELNEQRMHIQAQIFDEASLQAEAQLKEHNPSILLVHGQWHEGVLGVVANKLMDKFGRPAIVLAELEHEAGLMRGSMRGGGSFSCVRSLEACKEHLLRFGGHRAAAGLKLEKEKLASFRTQLWEKAEEYFAASVSVDATLFDGELPSLIALAEVEALERLAPWGQGNPEPLFLLPRVDLSGAKLLKEKHVKARVPQLGCDLIAFNQAETLNALPAEQRHFDVLVTPELNRFRGRVSLQLRAKLLRPSP